ncbi:chemotaxis protein MotB [uncultured Gammaproteobacteria bacterium]
MHSSRRGSHRSINAWPGWVDALSSLIMVIIFLLMVFVVSQFYLVNTLSGRDQALTHLNQKIAELNDLLNLERRDGAELRATIAQLSDELQTSTAQRERLGTDLATVREQRARLVGRLDEATARAETGTVRLAQTGRELEDAYKTIAADRETIELRLRELASLQADLRALREVRERMEGEIAALTLSADGLRKQGAMAQAKLEAEQAQRVKLGESLRDRSRELEKRVADEAERTLLAQKELERRDIRLRELIATLEAGQATMAATVAREKDLTEQERRQVAQLTRQLVALRDEMAKLAATLDTANSTTKEQSARIEDLSGRLNLALASKVEELARYRSEFFGRLREVLGSRADIRVVGDRFVFQSEVLFPTGQATLSDPGKAQLAQLAKTLQAIASNLPREVNWILRVDGHTDRRHIGTPQFPSNWELSNARALSVVKFLIEQGIPAERLAAAGFGEFQPLASGTSEEILARNRRIEIKFDQR